MTLWTGNAQWLSFWLAMWVTSFQLLHSPSSVSLTVALAAIWMLILINIRGVKEAGAVHVVTTVLKLVPLVPIGTAGFLWINLVHYMPFNQSGQSGTAAISAAAAVTLWAYLGFESATGPSGEVIEPEKTIPRATFLVC